MNEKKTWMQYRIYIQIKQGKKKSAWLLEKIYRGGVSFEDFVARNRYLSHA